MKAFVKTVSLTLCISVTMLFFSSYKKVEAAATGTLIASTVAVAIGAIVSYICAAAADYINSSLDSLSSDIIADLKWDKMEKDRIAAEAAQRVKDYMSSTEYRQKIMEQLKPTETVSEYPISQFIDAQAYFSSIASPDAADKLGYAALLALENSTQTITIDTANDKSTVNSPVSSDIVSDAYNSLVSSSGSGAAAGITSGISVINGKPQKVTTTYAESTVEIFDYLQLDYDICNTVFDILLDIDLSSHVNTVMSKTGKYLPFIIKDDKLYVMSSHDKKNTSYLEYGSSSSAGSGLNLSDGLGSVYLAKSYMAFRIANLNGQLCYAFFGCSRFNNPDQSIRVQRIYGKPKPTTYPILFNTPSYFNFGTVNSSFDNYEATYPVTFINASDVTDILSDDDIINKNYTSCGYFKGTSSSNFSLSGTIGTAGKMMSGTENAVQGGTNTTYSELSDIEKAIYALAKQQGITYEEMLEQSNLVVENGQIYLEGLDGVTHSIESLLSEFDKLLEQGDITNENIAASTEQLKAILEYLKGLNIEGLGSYIQQLETTLDGLKQGDEDREAILGDVLGQLQGLNDYLSSLDIESIGANIKSITDSISKFITAFKDTLFDGMTAPKGSFDYTPGDIIEHYTEQFPLYEQCKRDPNKFCVKLNKALPNSQDSSQRKN